MEVMAFAYSPLPPAKMLLQKFSSALQAIGQSEGNRNNSRGGPKIAPAPLAVRALASGFASIPCS